jgi:hypothetical protein
MTRHAKAPRASILGAGKAYGSRRAAVVHYSSTKAAGIMLHQKGYVVHWLRARSKASSAEG